MHLAIVLFYVALAWRFGDWRNWQRYYPTILFMILTSMFYEYVCYDYPLWRFAVKGILPNPIVISLVVTFVGFPANMLVFLGRLPKTVKMQIVYVIGWAGLAMLAEWISHHFNGISYYNGWNFGWSALFDLIMYVILRLHFSKPLWAWAVAILYVIWMTIVFDIPFKPLQ